MDGFFDFHAQLSPLPDDVVQIIVGFGVLEDQHRRVVFSPLPGVIAFTGHCIDAPKRTVAREQLFRLVSN